MDIFNMMKELHDDVIGSLKALGMWNAEARRTIIFCPRIAQIFYGSVSTDTPKHPKISI
jgi:hypothetical protein